MSSDDDTIDTHNPATAADQPTEVIPAVTIPGEREARRGSAVPDEVRPGRLERLRNGIRSGLASYRLRIVGWYVALLTIGSLATILVVGQLLFQRIDDGIRANLVREVEEFRSLSMGNDPATGAPFGTDVRRMFDVFVERHLAGRHEIVVTFVDGQPYARSAGTPAYALDSDSNFTATVANATDVVAGRMDSPVGAVDYVAVPVRVDGQQLGVFSAAGFRDLVRAEQEEIVLAALGVGMILVVIGSVLAWRLADRLLAPVSQTAATARSISDSDLSQRVEVRGYDEVADLARTFNEMLDRLEAAFAGQRRFLDDVGHELRTPLTIVRGHLELLEDGSPEELDRTRELVLDELDRMTRLVNELIVLAQAAQPDFLHRAGIDAAALARQVHEKVTVLGERDWRLIVHGDGSLNCDPQRVTQALLQLAANAVRHTQPGGRIELGVEVGPTEARFWVADDGAGIPEHEQQRVFERFFRGGGAPRAAGTGLGLSIVQAIAEAHGGRVELDSRAGEGSRFSLVLPR